MEQAKISIIVPVYQVEKYLRRCLDSIVNQTYKNLEIILIDDGSKDNSPAICDEYAKKDDRIKVLHQKNQGSSVARNQGLDVAIGKYIGFVDSDDWIEPNMYEELSSTLINSNADIAVTGCYWETKDGSRELYLAPDKYYDAKTLLEGTVTDNQPSTSALWSKLFVKECFDEIRFVPGVRSQDNICMVEILGKNPKVVVLQKCLYHYNKLNENAVTYKPSLSMEYGHFTFLKKYLALPSSFLTNREAVRQANIKLAKRAMRFFIQQLNSHGKNNLWLTDVQKYLEESKKCYLSYDIGIRYKGLYWAYFNCLLLLKIYARIRYR